MRSSSLFCSSKNLNLPILMLCRTLFIKTPGVGWGRSERLPARGAFAVSKERKAPGKGRFRGKQRWGGLTSLLS